MGTCENCGAETGQDAEFCKNCGAPVSQPGSPPAPVAGQSAQATPPAPPGQTPPAPPGMQPAPPGMQPPGVPPLPLYKPQKKGMSRGVKIGLIVAASIIVLLIIGLVIGVAVFVGVISAPADVANNYVKVINEGNMSQAYGYLATSTQKQTSESAFATKMKPLVGKITKYNTSSINVQSGGTSTVVMDLSFDDGSKATWDMGLVKQSGNYKILNVRPR